MNKKQIDLTVQLHFGMPDEKKSNETVDLFRSASFENCSDGNVLMKEQLEINPVYDYIEGFKLKGPSIQLPNFEFLCEEKGKEKRKMHYGSVGSVHI